MNQPVVVSTLVHLFLSASHQLESHSMASRALHLVI